MPWRQDQLIRQQDVVLLAILMDVPQRRLQVEALVNVLTIEAAALLERHHFMQLDRPGDGGVEPFVTPGRRFGEVHDLLVLVCEARDL